MKKTTIKIIKEKMKQMAPAYKKSWNKMTKKVIEARKQEYDKCPVCTSHNLRIVSKYRVECATCHNTFSFKHI